MRSGTPAYIAAIALLSLVPDGGMAQTYMVHRMDPEAARGNGELHISKAVLSGKQIRVWAATLLNPDCTAAGTMTTQVLTPPRHGKIDISDEAFYPGFVPPNPRADCDRRKSPGKQAFYTADAGFHGRDKLILQNATSEGRVRRIVVDIDVQ